LPIRRNDPAEEGAFQNKNHEEDDPEQVPCHPFTSLLELLRHTLRGCA
jgi:hypothetical protein